MFYLFLSFLGGMPAKVFSFNHRHKLLFVLFSVFFVFFFFRLFFLLLHLQERRPPRQLESLDPSDHGLPRAHLCAVLPSPQEPEEGIKVALIFMCTFFFF